MAKKINTNISNDWRNSELDAAGKKYRDELKKIDLGKININPETYKSDIDPKIKSIFDNDSSESNIQQVNKVSHNLKKSILNELSKQKTNTWMIINETDGIEADPQKFKSKKAATKAKELLMKRFKLFKEYKTADGRYISPTEVKLTLRKIQ